MKLEKKLFLNVLSLWRQVAILVVNEFQIIPNLLRHIKILRNLI